MLPALPLAILLASFDFDAMRRAGDARVANVTLILLLGARPDAMLGGVTRQSPEIVERVAKRLASEKRSPFDDERSSLAGAAFAERFTPSLDRVCGHNPKIWWSTPDGELAAVVGDLEREAIAPAYIVLVDSQGVVRGLGEERPAVSATDSGRRWAGMIGPFERRESYAAYAVMPDRRSTCSLGEIGHRRVGPGPSMGKPPA